MMPAEFSAVKRGTFSWSERRTDFVVVLLATTLAAGLSLLMVGDRSLWLDEGSSVYLAGDGVNPWPRLVHKEANMWLYYILLHLWLGLGDSETVVRSLSGVFAVATIPLVYVLGRRLFGSRAGAIASLLLAVHAYFISFAQEARGYTLLVFLVVLSSYFFVRAFDENSRTNWVGHGVATGLAIFTHFFAAQVYFTQIIAATLSGRIASKWRGLLLSLAILALLLLPILLWQPLSNSQLQWVRPFTPQLLYQFFGRIAGGSRAMLLLYLVFWVLALLFAVRKHGAGAFSRERWPYLLVAAWIVVPVAGTAGLSVLVKPVFVDRYLSLVLPAVVLLAAAGIARLQPQWLCVPVLLLFLGGSARCLRYWFSTNNLSDWRGATAYVLSQAYADDAALFYVATGKRCFDYYCGHVDGRACPTSLDLARETTVDGRLGLQLDTQLLSSLPTTHDRVWLLLAHEYAFADTSELTAVLDHLYNNYVLQSEQAFTGIRVRLYQRPP